MSLPLYERVALKRDLPEHSLRKGDVAVLVEQVAHPEGGEPGCVLEVFDALGESIARGCRQLLGLGESPSARAETSRYLRRWSEAGGFLYRKGAGRYIRYVPRPMGEP